MTELKTKSGRTITIELNALTGLIVFNIVILLVYIGVDYYNFNYIASFLGNASNQQISSSFGVIGYSINSNLAINGGLYSSMRFASPNFPLIIVLVLIIGNIAGLVRLRKE